MKNENKMCPTLVLRVRGACAPFLNILLCDWLRRDVPGTGDAPPRQAVEVKLAADGRVRAARVRNVVAVKGHHVTRDVTAGGGVCERQEKKEEDCFGFVHVVTAALVPRSQKH